MDMHHSIMGPPFSRSLSVPCFILLFLLINNSPTPIVSLNSSYDETECLNIPFEIFTSAVKSTISEISKVVSIISKVTRSFGNSRVGKAIDDCMDLLELSTEELIWALSTMENSHQGNHDSTNGTGDSTSDLRSWLSAALSNQDTCLEGFEGTNEIVKNLLSEGLKRITGLVGDILGMVRQKSNGKSSTKNGRRLSSKSFPGWFSKRDRHLLQMPTSGIVPDVVVATDGSGNFTTVMEAVAAAPDYSLKRYIIYVKQGVYRENIEIKKKKWNLMIIGDGMDATTITGNRNFVDGWTTYRSATFAVSGKGFIGKDLTIENTAGPDKHQAVAFRSDSDLSALYRCSFRGYQDTLYAHSLRQFYRDCHISGTVDFIFGNGALVFQNCQVLARQPLPNQKNTITAHGRKDPNQNTGFSFQYCNVSAAPDLLASPGSTETYLGRPWKQYSRTVFMESYMSDVVQPQGWLEWAGDFALNTLYYGEYMNFGPGASLGARVKWPGFHVISDAAQAMNFTVSQFLAGNLWLPSTGIKYTLGL